MCKSWQTQANHLKWVTGYCLAGLSWSQALNECTSANYLNISECRRLLHKFIRTLLAITYHAAMPANSGAGFILSATSVSLLGSPSIFLLLTSVLTLPQAHLHAAFSGCFSRTCTFFLFVSWYSSWQLISSAQLILVSESAQVVPWFAVLIFLWR